MQGFKIALECGEKQQMSPPYFYLVITLTLDISASMDKFPSKLQGQGFWNNDVSSQAS